MSISFRSEAVPSSDRAGWAAAPRQPTPANSGDNHPNVHIDPRSSHRLARTRGQRDQRSFLLQRAQPAMTGLIDGSLSTLAPIFAVAFLRSFISITLGGAIIVTISAALGAVS